MQGDKSRHTIWLTKDAWEKVKSHYHDDLCSTMNEYVENAIQFYTGYLDAEKASQYLPRVLGDVIKGTLGLFGDRMGRLLFKYAVEQNISNHILAADTDMDVQTYDRLRGRSYREVQETNGQISFQDDLIFQKTV